MNIQELKSICKPKKLTVAQEAKELLKNIKHEDWIAGAWYIEEGQKACAVGWYNRIKKGYICGSADNVLVYASEKFLISIHFAGSIITVNDNANYQYHESHPKDRVMHLLDDMIAAGY